MQAIARADGAFHELTRAGVDMEDNIRFCMQVLGTAELTDYKGPVELVVATHHNDDVLLGQWDPAGAWRRHPWGGQVRVTELDLTHAQLVQEGGWEHIFRHWRRGSWEIIRPDRQRIRTAPMHSTHRCTQQPERTDHDKKQL